jgi:hypothetical protein
VFHSYNFGLVFLLTRSGSFDTFDCIEFKLYFLSINSIKNCYYARSKINFFFDQVAVLLSDLTLWLPKLCEFSNGTAVFELSLACFFFISRVSPSCSKWNTSQFFVLFSWFVLFGRSKNIIVFGYAFFGSREWKKHKI